MEYIWLAKVCSGFSITSYREKKKNEQTYWPTQYLENIRS